MAKVVCHFTMSLDGFVAGPGHDMSWLAGVTVPPGLIDRYVESRARSSRGDAAGTRRSGPTVPTAGGGPAPSSSSPTMPTPSPPTPASPTSTTSCRP